MTVLVVTTMMMMMMMMMMMLTTVAEHGYGDYYNYTAVRNLIRP